MNLSISNIAWSADMDEKVYNMMEDIGFTGLEIAPTRIFADHPYESDEKASDWAVQLFTDYGLCVPSIQSIWYGRTENIFSSEDERIALTEYTKKAIDFAKAIGCRNLVFGCPRNRNNINNKKVECVIDFFRVIGDYASSRGTVIGIEANPPIYNTNFITTTSDAISFIREVDSQGIKLNLDVGTMLYNNEDIEGLRGNVHLISHVHISEPGLIPINRHELHDELYTLLCEEKYSGYVSIEMGKQEDIGIIEGAMEYVGSKFGRG